MSISLRMTFALAMLACFTSATLAQQGAISGTVINNGQPVPGVLVGVQAQSNSSLYVPPVITTRSDQDGAFRFTGLKPGRHLLTALSSGWTTTGRYDSFEEVDVRDGETTEGIKLKVVKGGVITGRVTTPEGQPLIGVSVNVNRNPSAVAASSKYQTDDRGIYRAYGLRPGDYFVSVGGSRTGISTLPLTYYPAGTKMGKAITVEAEKEITGIDLILRADEAAYLIQGRVIDAQTKQPVGGISIRYSGDNYTLLATRSDADGTFVIDHLSPGQYTLIAGGDRQSDYRSERLPVTISDQDVTGLELKLSTAASMSGTVVLEEPTSSAQAKLPTNLVLQVETGRPTSRMQHTPFPIGPDRQFKVAGLTAGTIKISLFNQEAGRGWFVKAIEYRGTVTTNTLSLQPGEEVTGVVIRLAHGLGRIAGRIVIPENSLPAGSSIQVAVFPPGETRTTIPSVSVKPDGTFYIQEVPPGTYDLRLMPGRGVPLNLNNAMLRVKETVVVNQSSETSVLITITPERQ